MSNAASKEAQVAFKIGTPAPTLNWDSFLETAPDITETYTNWDRYSDFSNQYKLSLINQGKWSPKLAGEINRSYIDEVKLNGWAPEGITDGDILRKLERNPENAQRMYEDYKSRTPESSSSADFWLRGATDGRDEGDIKGLRENIFGDPVMGAPVKKLIEYYVEEDKYNQSNEGYQPLLPRVDWTAKGLGSLIENTDTDDPMWAPVELGTDSDWKTPEAVIDFDDLERRRIEILKSRAQTGEVPFVAWDDVYGNRQVRGAPENKLDSYGNIGDAIQESLDAGTITERDIDRIGLLLKKEQAPRKLQRSISSGTQRDLFQEIAPILFNARSEAVQGAAIERKRGDKTPYVADPILQAANAVYLAMMTREQGKDTELPPDEGVWSFGNYWHNLKRWVTDLRMPDWAPFGMGGSWSTEAITPGVWDERKRSIQDTYDTTTWNVPELYEVLDIVDGEVKGVNLEAAIGKAREAMADSFMVENHLRPDQREYALSRYSSSDIQETLETLIAAELNKSGGFKHYDKEEDWGKNFRRYGNSVLATPEAMSNIKVFRGGLEQAGLTKREKDIITNYREQWWDVMSEQHDKVLSESDVVGAEYAEFRDKAYISGMSTASVLDEFLSSHDFELASSGWNAIKKSVWYAGADIINFTGVLTTAVIEEFFGDPMDLRDSLEKSLQGSHEARRDRNKVPTLFGEKHGLLIESGELVAPVLTDIVLTGTMMSLGRRVAGGITSAAFMASQSGVRTTVAGTLKGLMTGALHTGPGAAASTAAQVQLAQKISKSVVPKKGFTGDVTREVYDTLLAYNKAAISRSTTRVVKYSSIFLPAAMRSSSMMYGTMMAQLPDSMSLEQKRSKAMAAALTAGAITGTLTSLFSAIGRGGLEDILFAKLSTKQTRHILGRLAGHADDLIAGNTSYKILGEAVSKITTQALKDVVGRGLATTLGKKALNVITRYGLPEAVEEGLDETAQTFVETGHLGRNMTIFERLQVGLHAAILGLTMGVGTRALARPVEFIRYRGKASPERQALVDSSYTNYTRQVADELRRVREEMGGSSPMTEAEIARVESELRTRHARATLPPEATDLNEITLYPNATLMVPDEKQGPFAVSVANIVRVTEVKDTNNEPVFRVEHTEEGQGGQTSFAYTKNPVVKELGVRIDLLRELQREEDLAALSDPELFAGMSNAELQTRGGVLKVVEAFANANRAMFKKHGIVVEIDTEKPAVGTDWKGPKPLESGSSGAAQGIRLDADGNVETVIYFNTKVIADNLTRFPKSKGRHETPTYLKSLIEEELIHALDEVQMIAEWESSDRSVSYLEFRAARIAEIVTEITEHEALEVASAYLKEPRSNLSLGPNHSVVSTSGASMDATLLTREYIRLLVQTELGGPTAEAAELRARGFGKAMQERLLGILRFLREALRSATKEWRPTIRKHIDAIQNLLTASTIQNLEQNVSPESVQDAIDKSTQAPAAPTEEPQVAEEEPVTVLEEELTQGELTFGEPAGVTEEHTPPQATSVHGPPKDPDVDEIVDRITGADEESTAQDSTTEAEQNATDPSVNLKSLRKLGKRMFRHIRRLSRSDRAVVRVMSAEELRNLSEADRGAVLFYDPRTHTIKVNAPQMYAILAAHGARVGKSLITTAYNEEVVHVIVSEVISEARKQRAIDDLVRGNPGVFHKIAEEYYDEPASSSDDPTKQKIIQERQEKAAAQIQRAKDDLEGKNGPAAQSARRSYLWEEYTRQQGQRMSFGTTTEMDVEFLHSSPGLVEHLGYYIGAKLAAWKARRVAYRNTSAVSAQSEVIARLTGELRSLRGGYRLTSDFSEFPAGSPEATHELYKGLMTKIGMDPRLSTTARFYEHEEDWLSTVDWKDLQSQVVPGLTIGSRNPGGANPVGEGVDPSSLADLATLRESPVTYKKNALLLLNYPILRRVYKDTPVGVRLGSINDVLESKELDVANAKISVRNARALSIDALYDLRRKEVADSYTAQTRELITTTQKWVNQHKKLLRKNESAQATTKKRRDATQKKLDAFLEKELSKHGPAISRAKADKNQELVKELESIRSTALEEARNKSPLAEDVSSLDDAISALVTEQKELVYKIKAHQESNKLYKGYLKKPESLLKLRQGQTSFSEFGKISVSKPKASELEAAFEDVQESLEQSTPASFITARRKFLKTYKAYDKARVSLDKNKDTLTDAKRAASKKTDKIAGDEKLFPITTADEVYQTLREVTRTNLEFLIKAFPDDIRKFASMWYDGANIIANKFAAVYGLSLEQSAATLAIFSPQKDWYMNVSLAERTMHIWRSNQNTVFGKDMSAQLLRRAGQPELITLEDGTTRWEGKAEPVIEDGIHIQDEEGNLLFTNWDSASAAKKLRESRAMLPALEGRALKDIKAYKTTLDGKDKVFTKEHLQARFIRMFSELNDPSSFHIIRPDGAILDQLSLSVKRNPNSIQWPNYGVVEKAIRVMNAAGPAQMQIVSDELGKFHKIRSFYNNIVDPANANGHVTMDTHAIAALLWQPLSGNAPEVLQNFGSSGASGSTGLGLSGLYPAFAEAYKSIEWDEEGQRLLPRQVQSITWEAVRMMFPAAWKRNKDYVLQNRALWKRYENGEIELEEVQNEVYAHIQRTQGVPDSEVKTLPEAIADAARGGWGIGRPDWASDSRIPLDKRPRGLSDPNALLFNVNNDEYIHFTTTGRARQILSDGVIKFRPPYPKFGPDVVNAVSTVYGEYLPSVQVDHIFKSDEVETEDDIVAIKFKTETDPSVGYPEEVVWKEDVEIFDAVPLTLQEGKVTLGNAPNSIGSDQYVVYSEEQAKQRSKVGGLTDAEYQALAKDPEANEEQLYNALVIASRTREASVPPITAWQYLEGYHKGIRGTPIKYREPIGEVGGLIPAREEIQYSSVDRVIKNPNPAQMSELSRPVYMSTPLPGQPAFSPFSEAGLSDTTGWTEVPVLITPGNLYAVSAGTPTSVAAKQLGLNPRMTAHSEVLEGVYRKYDGRDPDLAGQPNMRAHVEVKRAPEHYRTALAAKLIRRHFTAPDGEPIDVRYYDEHEVGKWEESAPFANPIVTQWIGGDAARPLSSRFGPILPERAAGPPAHKKNRFPSFARLLKGDNGNEDLSYILLRSSSPEERVAAYTTWKARNPKSVAELEWLNQQRIAQTHFHPVPLEHVTWSDFDEFTVPWKPYLPSFGRPEERKDVTKHRFDTSVREGTTDKFAGQGTSGHAFFFATPPRPEFGELEYKDAFIEGKDNINWLNEQRGLPKVRPEDARVVKAYLDLSNPLIIDDSNRADIIKQFDLDFPERMTNRHEEKVKALGYTSILHYERGYYAREGWQVKEHKLARIKMVNKKAEGRELQTGQLHWMDEGAATRAGLRQAIVFDSSQIKSAEPVTFDRNTGEITQPEDRFNPEKKKIIHSKVGGLLNSDEYLHLVDMGSARVGPFIEESGLLNDIVKSIEPVTVKDKWHAVSYESTEALSYLIGGRKMGWTPHVLTHKEFKEGLKKGQKHWFLKHSTGAILDPAAKRVEPYNISTSYHNLKVFDHESLVEAYGNSKPAAFGSVTRKKGHYVNVSDAAVDILKKVAAFRGHQAEVDSVTNIPTRKDFIDLYGPDNYAEFPPALREDLDDAPQESSAKTVVPHTTKKSYERMFTGLIQPHLKGLRSGQKLNVLDFGAGTATGTKILQESSGDDVVVKAHEPFYDRERGDLPPKEIIHDADKIRSGSQDVIISHNVLNVATLAERVDILSNIYRALKEGGTAYVNVMGWSNIKDSKTKSVGPREVVNSAGRFQKGYTQASLTSAVSAILPEARVESAPKGKRFGDHSVVITKVPQSTGLTVQGTAPTVELTEYEKSVSIKYPNVDFDYDPLTHVLIPGRGAADKGAPDKVPRYAYHKQPATEAKLGKGQGDLIAHQTREYAGETRAISESFAVDKPKILWLGQIPDIYARRSHDRGEGTVIIDLRKLDVSNVRDTGQSEGNLWHMGNVPESALVGVVNKDGSVVPYDRSLRSKVGSELNNKFYELMEDETSNTAEIEQMIDDRARAAGWNPDDLGLLLHGTTHDFKVFDLKRSGHNRRHGYGIYFSSSGNDAATNYLAEGDDLSARIESLADYLYNYSDEYYTQEEAKELAEKQLKGQTERLITAYVKLDNPAVLGADDSGYVARLAPVPIYNEEALEGQREETEAAYRAQNGIDPGADLTHSDKIAIRRALEDWADANLYYNEEKAPLTEAVEAVMERYEDAVYSSGISRDSRRAATDYGAGREIAWSQIDELAISEATLEEVDKFLQEQFSNLRVTEEMAPGVPWGQRRAGGELTRQVFEELGYDGIVDRTVARELSHMGLKEGDFHVIAFKPSQVKSAVAERDQSGNPIPLWPDGTNDTYRFNPGDESYIHSKVSGPPEYLYHATFTDRIETIKEQGLQPFGGDTEMSNWVQAGNKTQYGDGWVFTFENQRDAVLWASKMDWEFNSQMGSGKISVVRLKNTGSWVVDSADPIAQAQSTGSWFKRPELVVPEDIDESVPVTTELVRNLGNDSIGDLFEPTVKSKVGTPFVISEVLDEVAEDEEVASLLQRDAGVSEGYTIYEHTAMVMGRWKSITGPMEDLSRAFDERINLGSLMPHVLALHDIGKPLAVEAGDKTQQHDYTLPILERRLLGLGHNLVEVELAKALVGHDIFGKLLKGEISTDKAAFDLRLRALNSQLPAHEFARLALTFYEADASSYPFLMNLLFTEDENGTRLLSSAPDEVVTKVGNYTGRARKMAIPVDRARALLPPEPGTAPIPEGTVRRFHVTGEYAVDNIRRDGLLMTSARGIEGPPGIYGWDNYKSAVNYGRSGREPIIEYFVTEEEANINPTIVQRDIPPGDIVGVHYDNVRGSIEYYLEAIEKIPETGKLLGHKTEPLTLPEQLDPFGFVAENLEGYGKQWFQFWNAVLVEGESGVNLRSKVSASSQLKHLRSLGIDLADWMEAKGTSKLWGYAREQEILLTGKNELDAYKRTAVPLSKLGYPDEDGDEYVFMELELKDRRGEGDPDIILEHVFVPKQLRGRGIAGMLLRELTRKADEVGATIYAHAEPFDTPGPAAGLGLDGILLMRLYENHGFEVAPSDENYSDIIGDGIEGFVEREVQDAIDYDEELVSVIDEETGESETFSAFDLANMGVDGEIRVDQLVRARMLSFDSRFEDVKHIADGVDIVYHPNPNPTYARPEAPQRTAPLLAPDIPKSKGYNVGPVYHGQNQPEPFAVFDPSKGNSFGGWNAIGSWFSSDEGTAKAFSMYPEGSDQKLVEGNIYRTYLDTGEIHVVLTKPELSEVGTAQSSSNMGPAGDAALKLEAEHGVNLIIRQPFKGRKGGSAAFKILTDLYTKYGGDLSFAAVEREASVKKFRKAMEDRNIRSIKLEKFEGDEGIGKKYGGAPDPDYWIVFKPEQIKSAQVETGVPMDQRFDRMSPEYLRTKVSAKDDARYMELAEDEDTNREELQQMVEERAKVAGYRVGPVFHGSPAKFSEFRKRGVVVNFDNAVRQLGHFFAVSESYAKQYGENVTKAYLKGNFDESTLEVLDGLESSSDRNLRAWKKRRSDKGFTGVVFKDTSGGGDFETIVVFNPNQIKSADPVTRDADGNVIPLSQRFDPESPRITRTKVRAYEPAGKELPDTIYVDSAAIKAGRSKLNGAQLTQYDQAREDLNEFLGKEQAEAEESGELYEKFTYDLVAMSGTETRFALMSSMTEPHPYVVESYKVPVRGDEPKPITKGRQAGQIYHRMDEIVDPLGPFYKFHKAVTALEEERGALGPFAGTNPKSGKLFPKQASGFESVWSAQVNSLKDYGYAQLKAELEDLAEEHLPEEYGGTGTNRQRSKVTTSAVLPPDVLAASETWGDFAELFEFPVTQMNTAENRAAELLYRLVYGDRGVDDKYKKGNKFWRYFLGEEERTLQRLTKDSQAMSKTANDIVRNFKFVTDKLQKKYYTDRGKEIPYELISDASGFTYIAAQDVDLKAAQAKYAAELRKINADPTLTPEQKAGKRKAASIALEYDNENALLKEIERLRDVQHKAHRQLSKEAPELQQHIATLRDLEDRLEQVLAQTVGTNAPGISATINKYNGLNLTRQYKIFRDKDWIEEFTSSKKHDAARAEVLRFLRKEAIKSRAKELIQQGTARRDAYRQGIAEYDAVPTGGRSRSELALAEFFKTYKDKYGVDSLRPKTDVPLPIRKALGEFGKEHSLDNLYRTILNVTSLTANTTLKHHMVQVGRQSGWLITKQEQEAAIAKAKAAGKESKFAEWVEVMPEELEQDTAAIKTIASKEEKRRRSPSSNPFVNYVVKTDSGTTVKAGRLLAPPDIAKDIRNILKKKQTEADKTAAKEAGEVLANSLAKASGAAMVSMTAGSVGFYGRQGLGNAFFAWAQGVGGAGTITEMMSQARRQMSRSRAKFGSNAYFAELQSMRVMDDAIYGGLIGDLLKGKITVQQLEDELDLAQDPSTSKLKSSVLFPEGSKRYKFRDAAGKAVPFAAKYTGLKWTHEKTQALIQAIDNGLKVVMYEHEYKVLRDARAASIKDNLNDRFGGMSDSELKREAASKIHKTLQTYTEKNPLVEVLTDPDQLWTFMTAPFARFFTEIPRIAINTPRLWHSEIKSGNPVIMARGRARRKGYTMTLGLFSVLGPQLVRMLFSSMSDDEERHLRNSLPEWAREQSFFFLGDGDDLKQFSMSYVNPFSPLTDAITRGYESVLEGDPLNALWEVTMSYLFNIYFSDQILYGAVRDASSNRDANTGREIYNPQAKGPEKFLAGVEYIAGKVQPPISRETIKALKAIGTDYDKGSSMFGTFGPDDYSWAGRLLHHALPFKIYPVEMKANARRLFREYKDGYEFEKRNLSKMKIKKGGFRQSQVDDIVAESHEGMVEMMQLMRGGYHAMRGMGLSRAEVETIMKDGGYSRAMVSAIRTGKWDLNKLPLISDEFYKDLRADKKIKRTRMIKKAIRDKVPRSSRITSE